MLRSGRVGEQGLVSTDVKRRRSLQEHEREGSRRRTTTCTYERFEHLGKAVAEAAMANVAAQEHSDSFLAILLAKNQGQDGLVMPNVSGEFDDAALAVRSSSAISSCCLAAGVSLCRFKCV